MRPPGSSRRPRRRLLTAAAAASGLAATVLLLLPAVAGAAEPLCAFQESVTARGTTATAVVHVVTDGCQLSLVSIEKGPTPETNTLFDSVTGTFAASETRLLLSVQLPCGRNSETDLVLGPPSIYPPNDLDLGAVRFNVDCSAPTQGAGSSGAGSGGSGGSGSSGGGGGALPDLIVTIVSDRSGGLVAGDVLTLSATVAARRGTGGSTGTHLLVSLPGNVTPLSIAQPGRGPGCTLTNALDCDLDWLSPPMSATVRIAVRIDSGTSVAVTARARQDQPDAEPSDNEASLILPLAVPGVRTVAAVRRLAFTAWLRAGKQPSRTAVVRVRLSLPATLVVKAVSRRGKTLAGLRRVTLPAGVSTVTLRLPSLTKVPRGSLLSLVAAGSGLRATQLVRLP